ncbi:hypothetical protein EMIHUDRAFT_226075 [Emiliania huxleyi CCMP1516]|uniref:Uncharacterized protein n=2 Tax=Emiliania huxleyi TaxID=2903 RepID=A0A0D3KLF3_EMIH1|nr:hypothetical protein EMIHUDRAFT_226075 [Emiliania huxleyi CCMP1516]EOD36588.1 hypothetical protein EMIHUDRAFT_226075 [Emiliania huxleyi CCMP1516]|eukprot:XP_005789017.1 hypothetical protein EMIHUDRAFT_226075 [Emiliania huxleyi CCMP1516]
MPPANTTLQTMGMDVVNAKYLCLRPTKEAIIARYMLKHGNAASASPAHKAKEAAEMPSLSTFGLTTLLLGGAFSKECVIKDVGRRLPWAPGWSFKLKDCTVLSLSDAGLGDSGVKVLATSLADAPSVLELSLINNGIGDEGCVALADALSSPGSGLATLYLENNAIGDRGAIALGAALERNTALETLGLLGNELTGNGRAALQKAGFAGSGLSLPGAEDEYQRLGSNGPARCSDDSRGVCAAAPSLASRVCRATCGVCDGYGVPPEEARRSAVPVACPAASAPPSGCVSHPHSAD